MYMYNHVIKMAYSLHRLTLGEQIAEMLDGRVVLGERERRGVIAVTVHRR